MASTIYHEPNVLLTRGIETAAKSAAGCGTDHVTLATKAIVCQPIKLLKPDPANPRRHTKKQIRQIADSIKTFGFNVPVLIDRDNSVICGHGRLVACCELGWTEVPTLRLDHPELGLQSAVRRLFGELDFTPLLQMPHELSGCGRYPILMDISAGLNPDVVPQIFAAPS